MGVLQAFLLLGIGFLQASKKANLSYKSPSPKPHLDRTGSVFALPTLTCLLKVVKGCSLPRNRELIAKQREVHAKLPRMSRLRESSRMSGSSCPRSMQPMLAFFFLGMLTRGSLAEERQAKLLQRPSVSRCNAGLCEWFDRVEAGHASG